MALHLAVDIPLNERWVPVSTPAKALALDVARIGGRIGANLSGPSTTPHCKAEAERDIGRLREALAVLESEL